MVGRLRAKPGGASIPVTIGDMADVALPGPYPLVYLVFNTLYNLFTQERQVDCFRNVARVLAPGGVFVIECFVPDPSQFDAGQRVEAPVVTEESVAIRVSRHDAAAQRMTRQYITMDADGFHMHPVLLRYAWPSELDLMARLAGLRLRERHADLERYALRLRQPRSRLRVRANPVTGVPLMVRRKAADLGERGTRWPACRTSSPSSRTRPGARVPHAASDPHPANALRVPRARPGVEPGLVGDLGVGLPRTRLQRPVPAEPGRGGARPCLLPRHGRADHGRLNRMPARISPIRRANSCVFGRNGNGAVVCSTVSGSR